MKRSLLIASLGLACLCSTMHAECLRGGSEIAEIYFLKRLGRAAHVLQSIHQRKIFSAMCQENCTVFDKNLRFNHHSIQQCMEERLAWHKIIHINKDAGP